MSGDKVAKGSKSAKSSKGPSSIVYEGDVTALDKLRRLRHSWLLRALLVVAAAGLLTVAYHYADRKHLGQLVHWVDAHRGRGAAVLVAVQITCTICLIPTGILAIAAGALFGFSGGLALIWAACVVGETLAFALGRHLFRAHIERISAAWPTWVALEAALREDGWKLVLLLRCCPASPFTLLNYALGSTSLPFSHFFWPSVFGIAPGIAVYVWGGNLIKDLSDVTSGPGGAKALSHAAPPQARVAFAVVSGVTAVAVLVGSAWYTKRAIARRLARVESGGYDAELGRQGSGCSRQVLVCNSSSSDAARPGMAHRSAGAAGRARQAPQAQAQGDAAPAAPAPAAPAPQQQQQPQQPHDKGPPQHLQQGAPRPHQAPPQSLRAPTSQQQLLTAGGL